MTLEQARSQLIAACEAHKSMPTFEAKDNIQEALNNIYKHRNQTLHLMSPDERTAINNADIHGIIGGLQAQLALTHLIDTFAS